MDDSLKIVLGFVFVGGCLMTLGHPFLGMSIQVLGILYGFYVLISY